MKLKYLIHIVYAAILVFIAGCVYEFEADLESQKLLEEYVTVDGDIIVGDTSIIYVGFTNPVNTKALNTGDGFNGKYALVWVEDEEGRTWWGKDTTLTISYSQRESFHDYSYVPYNQSRYYIDTRDLDINGKYRLCVSVPDKGEYKTPFKEVLIAQDIDTLQYIIDPDKSNIHIMLSASGKEGQTSYYRWHYREDWENTPPIIPNILYNMRHNYMYDVTPEMRDSIRKCMTFVHSYDILIESTDDLSENSLVNKRLLSFSAQSRRMVGLYCFTLYQTPLDKEGYDFYRAMVVNDDLGGLYAPFPNEIIGNVLCTTNSNTIALGYVNVCTRSVKRVFIDGNKHKLVDRNKCTKEMKVVKQDDWYRTYQMPDMKPYDYYHDTATDSTMFDKTYWGSAFCLSIGPCSPKPYFWPK